jgi:hypothetical protein
VPTAGELGVAFREALGSKYTQRNLPSFVMYGSILRLLVITDGVSLWNGGDYTGCAAVYRTAVMRSTHADGSLAKGVADREGKSTGAARDGQGWILCDARIRIRGKFASGKFAVSSQAICRW